MRNLKAVYHVNGREGLKDFSEADVRLLLSAKQLELDQTSRKLESRDGQELHMLLKNQLEAEVRDLFAEMQDREREIER